MGLFGGDVEIPDPAKLAREGLYTDMSLYPFRRKIEAAAAAGEKITINGKTYDFTGLGTADYNNQYADRMLQQLMDVQREYGPAYIEQRLKELEVADPEGYKARKNLYDRIKSDFTEEDPNRPLAERLHQTILGELEQGGQLDPSIRREILNKVRGSQVSRGNLYGNAAVAQEARTVAGASEAQAADRQARAIGFLTSGATPEDVAYRRNQQNYSNMANFLNGQTPTAQFQQLSGNSGAAPFNGGQPLAAGLNPNAAGQAINYGYGNYQSAYNFSQSQANPWLAGLSTGIGAFSASVNLGLDLGGNGNTPAAVQGGWDGGWGNINAGQV